MSKIEDVKNKFLSLYGQSEICLSASGRANIIGEHTDYYGGLVFPFAIDKAIHFSANKSSKKLNIYSVDYDEYYDENNNKAGSWHTFINKALSLLKSKYSIENGCNIAFGGDLPIGAGVSSSSALCCGFLEVIDRLNDLQITPIDKVNLAGQIEHGVGVKGGNMDQYAILFGAANAALLLDCTTMNHKNISLPDSWQFLMLHSGVKHNLVLTAYNERRLQGESALAILKTQHTQIKNMRDVSKENLIQSINTLSEVEYDRVLHVIEENNRVMDFIAAAQDEDVTLCGELLNASHESLRDLYDVSCDELDYLQSLAADTNFILGARMMGGGFGGCTINLVEVINQEELAAIKNKFKSKYGYEPLSFVVAPSQGIVVHE
jgi:galactokinase